MAAVQGHGVASKVGNTSTEMYRPTENKLPALKGMRATPQHLLVSLYSLRYMHSRDNKTKILYTLNFYRAIQKRLTLDLREFGTRERIDSHLSQPFVHSSDSDKRIVNSINLTKNAFEGAAKQRGMGGTDSKGSKEKQKDDEEDYT